MLLLGKTKVTFEKITPEMNCEETEYDYEGHLDAQGKAFGLGVMRWDSEKVADEGILLGTSTQIRATFRDGKVHGICKKNNQLSRLLTNLL